MKVQIATPELVVLEAGEEELQNEKSAQDMVRSALDGEGLAQ